MLFVADTQAGLFYAGKAACPMAIGKAGVINAGDKREGDGKTPLGRYSFEHGYYRADRTKPPKAGVDLKPIEREDGWCDAPGHPSYNQHVKAPFAASHEAFMREDGLYDMLFVLSHNRWPAVPHYGSAIFLHAAKEDADGLKPTQGCLALKWDDLQRLCPRFTRQSWLIIR